MEALSSPSDVQHESRIANATASRLPAPVQQAPSKLSEALPAPKAGSQQSLTAPPATTHVQKGLSQLLAARPPLANSAAQLQQAPLANPAAQIQRPTSTVSATQRQWPASAAPTAQPQQLPMALSAAHMLWLQNAHSTAQLQQPHLANSAAQLQQPSSAGSGTQRQWPASAAPAAQSQQLPMASSLAHMQQQQLAAQIQRPSSAIPAAQRQWPALAGPTAQQQQLPMAISAAHMQQQPHLAVSAAQSQRPSSTIPATQRQWPPSSHKTMSSATQSWPVLSTNQPQKQQMVVPTMQASMLRQQQGAAARAQQNSSPARQQTPSGDPKLRQSLAGMQQAATHTEELAAAIRQFQQSAAQTLASRQAPNQPHMMALQQPVTQQGLQGSAPSMNPQRSLQPSQPPSASSQRQANGHSAAQLRMPALMQLSAAKVHQPSRLGLPQQAAAQPYIKEAPQHQRLVQQALPQQKPSPQIPFSRQPVQTPAAAGQSATELEDARRQQASRSAARHSIAQARPQRSHATPNVQLPTHFAGIPWNIIHPQQQDAIIRHLAYPPAGTGSVQPRSIKGQLQYIVNGSGSPAPQAGQALQGHQLPSSTPAQPSRSLSYQQCGKYFSLKFECGRI